MDAGAIRLYVLRLQRKNLLCPHACCQHEADRMAHFIMGQFCHKPLNLLLGKCFPPLCRAFGFHLFRKTHRVLANQIIGLGLLHDLIEHGAAFCHGGIGFSIGPEAFQKVFYVQGLEAVQLPLPKCSLQNFECVTIAFVSCRGNVVLVALVP